MKCPKCSAPLREEELYCEKCGQEIQIVPEYDAELEHNILESIERIADDFTEEIRLVTRKLPAKYGKKKFLLGMAGGVFAALIIVAGVMWQYHSYSYQLKKANGCYESKKYEAAVKYFTRAYELDQSDVKLLYVLADTSFRIGREEDFQSYLTEALLHPGMTEALEKEIYPKLLGSLEREKDYRRMSEILAWSESEEIRTSYQDFLAVAPVFSYDGGTYEKVVPLKISSATVGKIYYTLDGSTPTADSQEYQAPILLEGPEVTVKAIAVNQYGIASEEAQAVYQIRIKYQE